MTDDAGVITGDLTVRTACRRPSDSSLTYNLGSVADGPGRDGQRVFGREQFLGGSQDALSCGGHHVMDDNT
ncbi:hypothetical protein [Streptomyces violascens]|uniref:hypothetical protein n=1 Tax=Streptomyces violascens TaxID=67381 RepID=UPI00368DE2CA